MIWLGRERARIALAQMPVVQGARKQNLEVARGFIEEAARGGARLVVLPEAFSTGINLPDLHGSSETFPEGPAGAFLAANARLHQVYIVAGVLEKQGRDIYDSVVLVNPLGTFLAVYRRWFLWQMEKDFLARGAPAEPVDTPLGRLGLIAGYDLNFPEACRGLFRGQVDLIVCPAAVFDEIAYPAPGLCRARAFENHCYFALCACLGEHPFAGARFAGCSMVACDPLFALYEDKEYDAEAPDVVARAGTREQVLLGDLNLAGLARRRKKVPQYEDLALALEAREEVAL